MLEGELELEEKKKRAFIGCFPYKNEFSVFFFLPVFILTSSGEMSI